VLRVKGKIIRWQKAALKCTKRKLRASTHPIFIVLIHGRPVGEVRGFLLYAGQEKWIIYYRSGWNKLSLLCRWVPRVRGDETNWLINKKNKTSALTASPSGNSIETWVSCRLIRAGWKISWRVTWFQSPSHHQLTAATVKMLTNETHRSGRSFPLSSQKCNQKIDIDIKSSNSRRKLRSINYKTIFCFYLLDADIQSI
jgi:hypothetical protein